MTNLMAIGLLLPCNVIVYESSPGRSVISAMAPMAALGLVGENADLRRSRGRPTLACVARSSH